jgi:hypothetical protein
LPLFLYNIALVHRQRGDCASAASYYRRYLQRDPDASNAERIEKRIAEMDLCVARKAQAKATPTAATVATPPTAAPATLGRPAVRPHRWPGLTLGAVGLAIGLGGGIWAGLLDRRYRELSSSCAPSCSPSSWAGLDRQEIAAWTLVGVGAAVLVAGGAWAIAAHVRRGVRVQARLGGVGVSF